MKLIVFKEDRLAINVEKIDEITTYRYNSEQTAIYIINDETPYIVNKPFEEVIEILRLWNESEGEECR